ncbi:MAG: hypothetical protein OEM97_03770 [Acidimicrobiia bacterium]|nr:hypothetical protein [Acidimicrobiia bacterium]
MDEAELAAIRHELAAIQDRLLELPSDAFGERFELRARQDELRERVRVGVVAGDILSADQLRQRIARLERTITAHYGNRLSHISGPQTGQGGGIDPVQLHEMHRRMDAAAQIDDTKANLRKLRDRLAAMERGDTSS